MINVEEISSPSRKRVLTFFIVVVFYAYSVGSNTITYQGTVTTSGGSVPANGNYAMRFALWDLESGGDSGTNRLWQETHTNADAITVTNGAFSTELGSITAFPANFFKTNANLWLEVEVDLTGTTGSGLQVYSPRVRFTATPYAFHSDNADTLDSLHYYSFLRKNTNNDTTGIFKFLQNPTGSDYSLAPVQICPTTFDAGEPLFCIYTASNHMILAREPGSLTVSDVIQAGTILDPVAYNRLGNGTATQADIAHNDDLLINGSLEVKGSIYNGKTGYVSVSPCAFNPSDDTYKFFMISYDLYKDYGQTSAQNWWAPVYLPNGAVVTEFKVWYFDYTSEANLTVKLIRAQLGTSGVEMAAVTTSGSAGVGDGTDTSISYATVDNSYYVYYIMIQFPAVDTSSYITFRGARIKYTTTGP